MKEWYTAKELADLLAKEPLADWPATQQRTKLRLKKLAISSRKRLGREGGGGREYSLRDLPKILREHITNAGIERSFESPTSHPATSEDMAGARVSYPPLEAPAARMSRRRAKELVLHHYERFVLGWDGSRMQGVRCYCDSYAGLSLPSGVYEVLGSRLSEKRLLNWLNVGIDEGYGRKANGGLLDSFADGGVAVYIASRLLMNPHFSADHIKDMVEGEFEGMAKLSLRRYQQWIARWKREHTEAYLKETDPDRFKSVMRVCGRDMNYWVNRPNQLWEIDASPADVMCVDGRYHIYALIDIYTRRMVVSVAKTARTDAMLGVIRKGVMRFGVPEMIRTDNGSDFRSVHARSALRHLAIDVDVTAPFSPEKKGTVERAIGTLQRGLMPLLPGFVGHSVADRKKIEGRKGFAGRLGVETSKLLRVDITSMELQAYCDEWLLNKYERREHSGLKGLSPREQAERYSGALRVIDDERLLDVLLSPVAGTDGYRIASKQGIRVDGGLFICPEVVVGGRYFCRHDQVDMGRIYIFDESGEDYVGVGECAERLGIDPTEAMLEARREQERRIKEELEPLRKEIRKVGAREAVELINRERWNKGSGEVVKFRRDEGYETASLEGARDALRGGVKREGLGKADEVRKQALIEEFKQPKKVDEKSTPSGRYGLAKALLEKLKRGEEVGEADLRWVRMYEQTPEYRGFAVVHGDIEPEKQRRQM